jgi:hypothetical protein
VRWPAGAAEEACYFERIKVLIGSVTNPEQYSFFVQLMLASGFNVLKAEGVGLRYGRPPAFAIAYAKYR